jgi:cytochrome c
MPVWGVIPARSLVPALAAASVLLLALAAEAALVGHGGPVRGVAVAPDGRTAITAGFDYNLILWDLARARPLARLVGHDAPVNAVAMFPDGRRAASVSDDGTLAIWNLAAATLAARWAGHRGKVAAVAVSSDGMTIASGGWDREVRLWNAATGASRRLAGHEANVNAVAFSPDGVALASGDYDGRILLWRVADGSLVAAIDGNGFAINALAFAPDGRLLSAAADKTVRIWDAARRRELLRYEGHDSPVVSLAVSRDGTLVASGGTEGAIELWRPDGGTLLRTLYAHHGPVWALALTPDGQSLLSGGLDGVVRVWDIAAGREAADNLPAVSSPEAPADRGALLFRKCSACHDLVPRASAKAGPTLYGLFGRRAGSVPDYPYSPALRDSGLVWTPETVDRLFAQGPQAVAPGSKMPLQKMPDAEDRAELIEYLERATRP